MPAEVANQSASRTPNGQSGVTKNCSTKLTSTQRHKIGKKEAEVGVTVAIWYYNKHISPRISQPSRLRNSTIIYLTGANET